MRQVLLFLLITSSLTGQQPELTLQMCLDLAYDNNLDLRRSANNFELADIGSKEARWAQLPNLNLQSSGSIFSGRVVDPTTNDFITESFISNDAALTSNVIIYNGGRLQQQKRQGKLDEDIAQAQFDNTKDNISLAVINAFLNVVLSQENLANSKGLLEVSQGQLSRLRQQVAVGSRAKIDELNLEVQVAQDQQSVINLENEMAINRLRLAQLIRWEGDTDFVVKSPAMMDISDRNADMYSFETVYKTAVQSLPAIRAVELAQERASTQTEIAKSGYYPSLSANALLNTRYSDAARSLLFEDQWVDFPIRLNGQQINAEFQQRVPVGGEDIPILDQWDQNLGYGVGLNLNIPLFNRWSTTANVQRARIQEVNADLDTEIAKDNLKIDIQNALASARAARSNYEAAMKTYEVAQNAFNSSEQSFEVGGANLYELSQARINMDNAQRSVVSSKYNYIFRIKVLDFYLGRDLN